MIGPTVGTGSVSRSRSRNVDASGSRTSGRYADRSARVMKPPLSLEVICHEVGRLTLIELVGPVLRDALEGPSVIGLDQALADPIDGSIWMEVDLAACVGEAEDGCPLFGLEEVLDPIGARHPEPIEIRVDVEPIEGEPDRRLEELRPVHAPGAKAGERLVSSADEARHHRRLVPEPVAVPLDRPHRAPLPARFPHVRARCLRGSSTCADDLRDAAIGVVEDAVESAGDPAVDRVDNALGEGCRDGCVGRIPTRSQDLGSRV